MHSPPKKTSPLYSIDDVFSATIRKPISPVRPFPREEKKKSPRIEKKEEISFTSPKTVEYEPMPVQYHESKASITSRQSAKSHIHKAEEPMVVQQIPSIHEVQKSPSRTDKLLERQPHRITAREQQLGLSMINSDLQFLSQVRVSHLKVLADIESRISQLKRDKLKYQYPTNTY